jgi:hypothetical protein
MRVHKQRLTVDYAHNESEVLGYVNHFDTETGDLYLSGALTPWREDDRTSEVMFKMAAGVPYEASIFFGGDGIKIEEIGEGMTAMVNGRQFDGPGVVIREWPLRGVAICPYGADANTEASAMAQGETLKVETVTTKQETKMEAVEQAVEVKDGAEAQAVEVPPVETEAGQKGTLSAQAGKVSEIVIALTAERDALAAGIAELRTQRDKTDEALTALTADRDALAGKLTQAEADIAALKAERDEACRKLAAIEAGAPPVSAAPAPEGPVESAFKKAQKSSPHKRA